MKLLSERPDLVCFLKLPRWFYWLHWVLVLPGPSSFGTHPFSIFLCCFQAGRYPRTGQRLQTDCLVINALASVAVFVVFQRCLPSNWQLSALEPALKAAFHSRHQDKLMQTWVNTTVETCLNLVNKMLVSPSKPSDVSNVLGFEKQYRIHRKGHIVKERKRYNWTPGYWIYPS